jgi:hypothetical protein
MLSNTHVVIVREFEKVLEDLLEESLKIMIIIINIVFEGLFNKK